MSDVDARSCNVVCTPYGQSIAKLLHHRISGSAPPCLSLLVFLACYYVPYTLPFQVFRELGSPVFLPGVEPNSLVG